VPGLRVLGKVDAAFLPALRGLGERRGALRLDGE
jgi:hypothetical protein